MKERKNLFFYIGEWWETRQTYAKVPHRWRHWLPTPGNIIFTLLVVGLMIMTQGVWALPNLAAVPGASATTINYQGRLSDNGGNPLSGTYNLDFAIYDAVSDGNLIWGPESHTNIAVNDALFNVGLGSQTAGGIPTTTWDGDRYLEITVNGETLAPRELIRSVPIAGMALTVPDGAIGTEQLADGVVETAKIADGAVETAKIADGAVTPAKLDREYVKKSGDTMTGGLSMNGAAVSQVGNLRGHGSSNPAQLHMPAGSNQGNLYINWHTGRALIFGGGQETPKFSVDTNGNYWAAGTKSAVVAAGEFGNRKMYAVEATDVRFIDEGMNQLQNGVARVTLDAVFLETVEGEYLIHITPYGSASLYVDEVGKDYFIVKVHDGKDDVSFAWRLSANRKGYSGVRMESINLEKLAP